MTGLAGIALVASVVGLLSGRHPLHTTHTDLVEGPAGRVTLTVRSFRDDLGAALRKRDRGTGDSALAGYVGAMLELRDPAGRPVALVLDSVRSEGEIMLISLHTTVAPGLRGASVRQRMQMELYEDQVNVLQARYAGQSSSFLFLPGDEAKRLP